MGIPRSHKAFVLDKITPISAKSVDVGRAFGRFLLLLRTNGRGVSATLKTTLRPSDLAEIPSEDDHFEGFSDPKRKRLVEEWLVSDFIDGVNPGRGGQQSLVVAGIRPLHSHAVKLIHPKYAKDYGVSDFLYNVFRGKDHLVGQDGFITKFFSIGARQSGEFDLKLQTPADLDVETLFLLRMLDQFSIDKPDQNRGRVSNHTFVCEAQKELFINDIERLFAYSKAVPRRELVRYLITLISFHLALYHMKLFRVVSSFVEQKKKPCTQCLSFVASKQIGTNCSLNPRFFVDLTNGQNATCHKIASEEVDRLYAEMYRYFKAHLKLKKLDEFAQTLSNESLNVPQLVALIGTPDADAYFRTQIRAVTYIDEAEGEAMNPEISRIMGLDLPPLDKYVEIILTEQFGRIKKDHRDLMAVFCGMNKDTGFLQGGKGRRKRKFVLGNELLEVLVQLAVVDYNPTKGLFTRPIQITEFVKWLKERYGILIRDLGDDHDSIEIAQALDANFDAMKNRLRQLGFFVDLSDASNSQVIRPRFDLNPPSAT